MSTVREKINNALTLFWAKISTVLVRKANIVDNCVSTSTAYPLSANQGTQLQTQIDELNTNKISSSSMNWIPNGTTIASLLYVPGISCYSVNPGTLPSPSIENMAQYRTIIVFKLSEYGVVLYFSVLGGMQIYNNNNNKWSIVKHDD